MRRLKSIDGVAFATLSQEDIVRHQLVQKIVEAYEQDSRPVNSGIVRFPSDSNETED